MSKHTPGPWRVETTAAGDGWPIVEIGKLLIMSAPCHGDSFAPAEIDARLIAAAPEMLALLRDILRAVDDHEYNRGLKIERGNPAYIAILALVSKIQP